MYAIGLSQTRDIGSVLFATSSFWEGVDVPGEALSCLVLTRLPATGHYSPRLAAVMLVGFGTAGTAFGTMVTATRGVASADQGVTGGVINTSRQIGAAIGAALLPAVALAVSHGVPAAGASGARAAMLTGAAAAALATVIAVTAIRATRPARHARPAEQEAAT